MFFPKQETRFPKQEAYNLYDHVERFKVELRRHGYRIDCLNSVIKKVTPPRIHLSNTLYVGEIVANRYLIIHTRDCKKGDRRFDRAVSKLQKLVGDFEPYKNR